MFYLDHCGSTPIAPEVERTMIDFIKSGNFGNPTAVHHDAGQRAFIAIEEAREQIAGHIGAKSKEIIFTSGASEANNLVLWGFALRYRTKGCHILFGATEHKSVFDTAQSLVDLDGVTSSEIKVLANGSIDLQNLEAQLMRRKGMPILVAVMHTNNEVPSRNPVEDIAELCRRYGAFFHCDGVQGFVRESLDFNQGTYGSYVISGHKIYGPKGFGVLVLGNNKLSARITPPYHGGAHEHGLRPGTHNTLAIIAGAEAIKVHSFKRGSRVDHMQRCAKAFVERFLNEVPDAKLTLPLSDRAAGLVNFYVPGLDAPTILLENPDICINRGASCIGAGGEAFSHVPKALGLPIEVQANVLRASFGEMISIEQSDEAASLLARRILQLRGPR